MKETESEVGDHDAGEDERGHQGAKSGERCAQENHREQIAAEQGERSGGQPKRQATGVGRGSPNGPIDKHERCVRRVRRHEAARAQQAEDERNAGDQTRP